MKHFLYILVIATITWPVSAQVVQSKSYGRMLKGLLAHSVTEISVPEAAKQTDVIFLDAREKEEFDVSHIKNAVWVGSDDFNPGRLSGIPKSTRFIVYCAIGYRSEKVAEKLVALGYAYSWNLYGGIFEWKNQGYPVYDNNAAETEYVHAYNRRWGAYLNAGIKVYQ